MPFLLIVLIAEVETFNTIQRFSSGMKNFLTCRFGINLLLLFLLEKETLFPTSGFFPVKSQTLDMTDCFKKMSCKYRGFILKTQAPTEDFQ